MAQLDDLVALIQQCENDWAPMPAGNDEGGPAAGNGGNGSIYIRDVQTGEVRVLVPPDNSGQYTLERFYKNRVIYSKYHQLWSIDVTGSNNFKLFELPTTVTNR